MNIELDGRSLTLSKVCSVANGATVSVAEDAWLRVRQAKECVDELASSDDGLYGVTTGVGSLLTHRVSHDDIARHQTNIVRSSCAGVGSPLSRCETRAMMCLRANVLVQGCSGVRRELIQLLVDFLNAGVHPVVPSIGSVGASGDLIPLAYVARALLAEGACEFRGTIVDTRTALELAGLEPLTLQVKEGLALINGTEAMGAVGGLALVEAQRLGALADVIAALSISALGGSREAYDEQLNRLRPHRGQFQSARRIRGLLEGGAATDPRFARLRPQAPYSLRCAPQVHGASADVIKYAAKTVAIEINAVTDNPIVFPEERCLRSGGNFHGQPLAMAFDCAAMAVAELGSISERRLELLVNPAFSGLPRFLTREPGVCSGLTALPLLAAALVNQNKVLANPACTDSIPGNGGMEDHVSFGLTSSRKLRDIVVNVRTILAVELLAAAQAVELLGKAGLSSRIVQIHDLVRVRVAALAEDRALDEDIGIVVELLAGEDLVEIATVAPTMAFGKP